MAGQAILDRVDSRHKAILPAHVWGDGDPAGVSARAAEELKNTARAARQLGLGVVNGFTGSSIWHLLYSFPPVPQAMIDAGFKLLAERFHPILDVFAECNVKFALEVHPTEIAFDLYTAQRALAALDHRPEFGFNFDPSHLIWQGVDPAKFIRKFPDRIYHVHMKDAIVTLDGLSGILSSHLNFGDARRGWDFRSLGRGGVDFESIIRALNDAGYAGPLSVEWEDSGMERERGARESLRVSCASSISSRAESRSIRHSRRPCTMHTGRRSILDEFRQYRLSKRVGRSVGRTAHVRRAYAPGGRPSRRSRPARHSSLSHGRQRSLRRRLSQRGAVDAVSPAGRRRKKPIAA